MLTKETKQQADKISEQIADILGACSIMAKCWEKRGEEYRAACANWNAWQYMDNYEAKTNTPEEAKKAQETRRENPKQWAENVEKYATEREAARVALFVARVNFINYLNYCAELVAELVRPFWRGFALRKGAEDLGEYLTPQYKEKDTNTAHAFRLYFKISGGNVGAQLFPSSFIRLDVRIFPRCIACGIAGECLGVKMGEDVPDNPKDKTAPHLLTVAEYKKTVAKLEKIEEEARQQLNKLTQEARDLVRGSGLYGFAEFLAGYHLTISK